MEKPRNRPTINPTHKQNNGRPRMTELVMLGTSIVTPPYHSSSAPHHNHHHHSPKPKSRNPNSSPKTLLSTPSKAIPTAHHKSSAPPILSTVRWNHRNSSSLLTHYASLASKLAGDGRLEDLTMVAESVIASGVDPSHFVAALNVSLVATGVAKNLREGNVRLVVEVLQKVDQLGIPALKLVDEVSMELLKRECVKIANCGDVDAIVELMETLQGFGFPIKELVDPYHIIKICIEKCNPVAAVRYACILPHDRVLFCNIVSEFGRKRNLDSALIAYEAFKQELGRPNMYLYRTIIDACGLCGDYMKSREIYEDLLDQKIIPNVYVFNSLMNVNAQHLSYTLTVYKSMQNLGVVADVASYNILLKACCLAGRVNMAQDIYREVKQLESTGSLKLDVFTYCTIITVFADAKLWQMALKVKEDMLSSGVTPNSFTWSSLISACANAGLVEQAMQLFKEMLLSGCEPNSHCCNIILHACVEGRQYDRAFRHFKSWKRGEFMETFGAECSNRAENIEFTHKKFHFTPTSTTYNILMKACGGDYQRAKALMDEMKTAGISPNHISWSILIDISGGSGNLVGAVQTLKNMRAAGVKPDVVAYTTAIKVCVESKRLKQAFSLFAEMKRYQINPNLITYNTLLRARSRYGSLQEVQQCLSIYQDMRKAGYKSNDYYLKQLIEEWCEGIIQGNDLSQGPHPSYKRTDLGRTHGLLLEKVAAHLQNSIAESLTINLQGMSKVEARIVVLAVLRRIKENYAAGLSVKDDMWITLGADEVTEKEPAVKDAILKLLQIELGLDVQCLVPKLTGETDTNLPNHLNSDSDRLERNSKLVSSARRPTVLERIRVTRISLDRWLQRRVGSLKR